MKLEDQIAKHEADKNVGALEDIKADAEMGMDGATVGLAEQAIARIKGVEEKAQEVETTSPSQVSQVENQGGSQEEVLERTKDVDKEIEEVKSESTKQIEEVKGGEGDESTSEVKGEAENSEISPAMEEVKNQTAEFETYNALSPENKAYIDTVNKLKEEEIDKQKKYDEDRGFVYIDNEKISIDDLGKNPENLKKFDFLLNSSIDNLDLLVGKIPSEKIYLGLLEKWGPEKTTEKIALMPSEAKIRFVESLSDNYRQDLVKKYQGTIASGISNSDESLSFMYSLRSVNLPLKKHEKSGNDYIQEVMGSKKNFLEYYEKSMSKNDAFNVSRVFKGSELKQLFRATEFKYLPREKVVEMTKDMIKAYGEIKRTDMQPEIIKNVLALKREKVITEEEADKILSL